MRITAGKRIGIVGHSGNGKTTITSLLLGFYQVNKGLILINDITIVDIDQIQLRKKIGIVSQDVIIFEDTIRYNLNLGNDYSDDEIYDALKSVEMLNEKLLNATLIVISHRFETIRSCQEVVVINNYTVEAIDTPEALIVNSSTYRALYGK